MADKYKTLPIGTIFTYNGDKYKVCEDICLNYICSICAFKENNCDTIKHIRGNCGISSRTDNKSVYYKQINETMKKDSGNVVCPTFNTDNSLNDLQIDCPNGYSIDVEHSDLSRGIIKFKKDNITLEDIYDNQGKDTFVTNVVNNNRPTYNKIATIATLMDIANYYNKDWKPDWNNPDEHKYYIVLNNHSRYVVDYSCNLNYNIIYFKNRKDAQAVVDNPNFKDILDEIFKV